MIFKFDFTEKYKKFNFDWKFNLGELEASAANIDYDDSDWRLLDLPHDWSIEGSFDTQWASGTGYLPTGFGWYRKSLLLSENMAGKKMFIRFDGIYKNSEVWMNGHFLGKRPYGYSSFHYDLSPYLHYGDQPNVIAIKVSHPDYADSRWYTGSGIYRNVFLSVSDPLYIKPYGIFATTPVITKERAEVQIESALVNEYSDMAECTLLHLIKDVQGSTIAYKESTISIPALSEQIINMSIVIENPVMWSLEHPYLYSLETRVLKECQMSDQNCTPLGIRHFCFDRDTGFYLNGINIKMKGVCVHHDAGTLGAAVPVKVWVRRLQLLKEAGVNAIRMSHNPPTPELLDLCDTMGFVVMDEAFDEWELPKNKWVEGHDVGEPALDGYATDFEAWAEIDLRDMILRDRNHPSIVFWSIGNELDFPNDPYSHPILGERYKAERPDAGQMGRIAEKLAAIVRKYDSSRPVTAALAHPLMTNETTFPDALDLVGYNYMEHRYAGDRVKYPDRIIYGSENGRDPEAWLSVASNDYICAQFIWTGFDYLGEAKGWPIRNSTSGMLDLAGFKKPLYYFKQSLWSDKNMVQIGILSDALPGDRLINWHRDVTEVWLGQEGQGKIVAVCSNCPEVELRLNDKSLGIKQAHDFIGGTAVWEIPYSAGVLKAVGMNGGVICCTEELRTPNKPAKLSALSDTRTIRADREDVAHVEVRLLDQEGYYAYGEDRKILCEIAGPGEIIGIESGNPASLEYYRSNKRLTHHGKMLVYVKSSGQLGTISLHFSSTALEPAAIDIIAY